LLSSAICSLMHEQSFFMKSKTEIYLLCIMLLTSCKLTKTAKAAPEEAEPEWIPWVMKYERSPCFGECPVYVFYLLEDHSGLIEVKKNLREPGWYQAPLDQEAVHEIIMDIEPVSWWNEDLRDQPEIADLPVTSMVYKHKDGLRRCVVQNRISNQVAEVFQKMEHLVSEARWVATDDRPMDPNLPEPTDVIVHLKQGVDIQVWMKKYDRFGIRLKKRVAPNQQYFVVTKDADKGSSNDFFQYIKLDEEVIDAQWDAALTPRE
jgi:hypothetical protein